MQEIDRCATEGVTKVLVGLVVFFCGEHQGPAAWHGRYEENDDGRLGEHYSWR